MRCRRHGFSMVEMLVVLAIISILMALYLPVLSKAMRKAKDVAAKEGLRQDAIGRYADGANVAGPNNGPLPDRNACREAFRTLMQTGKQEEWVTKMLYAARNDDEFEAYWNTLLNPNAADPLEFEGRSVVATDFEGNEYLLPVIDDLDVIASRLGNFPVGWTYISTDLSDTSTGNIGGDVLFSGGHVEYVRYPSGYPMSPTVADLSHKFLHPDLPLFG
ncbi:MAG: hypothetical protein AMXMBFR84_34640 [Candidatus Hydrogenedentota bacterium]